MAPESRVSKKPKAQGMRAIAKKAGVAPITVSRALADPDRVSPATRERILQVIDNEGFIPDQMAGNMKKAARMIGSVVPALINAGIAEQVQGMAEACQANGYQMLLVQCDFSSQSEEQAIRSLIGWRPSGLILQAFLQSRTIRNLLEDREIPVVELSEIRGRRPINIAVGISNFDASYAMTCHLINKGYDPIAFVEMATNPNDRLRQRRLGYRKALEDNGIPYREEHEIWIEVSPQGGAMALDRLMERDPGLRAIFCSSDAIAIGLVQECHRRKLPIPERIAVAGFGDLDIAETLYPSLTTVKVKRYEMGRMAVEELIRHTSGTTKKSKVIDLKFEIIERESA